jgi:hypothetical protein
MTCILLCFLKNVFKCAQKERGKCHGCFLSFDKLSVIVLGLLSLELDSEVRDLSNKFQVLLLLVQGHTLRVD